MKTLTKTQAVGMLVELFDSRKLTFRSMAVLKSVFDEAVSTCNTLRLEAEADAGLRCYHSEGYLPSKDAEDDARYTLGADLRQQLEDRSILCDDVLEDVLVDILIDKCEYTSEDMYKL